MAKFLIEVFIVNCIFLSMTGAMMTGGWTPVKDLNSSNVKKYAEFAAVDVSRSMNSLYHWKPMEIVAAQKQVVAGVNYKISMKMGPTECKKNKETLDLSQCEFISSPAPKMCDAVVYDRSWEPNSTKVTHSSCH